MDIANGDFSISSTGDNSSTVPYYLAPVGAPSAPMPSANISTPAGASDSDTGGDDYSLSSMWGAVASNTSAAVNSVENVASKAVTGVENGAKSVASGAKSLVSAPLDYIGNAASTAENKILIYGGVAIVVILVAVMVLGKSGIIGQAAGFGRPV